LNRTVGGKNQLDTLQALGLFDAPIPAPYAAALVTPYPGQAGAPGAAATLEQRARSYMHANCANCHRPDGEFQDQDYRYGVSLKDTSVCNAEPVKGTAGVPGALILVPGAPDLSLIWLRMGTLETRVRMPQLATHQVDEQGLKLIGDWISSLTDCPP
jgi:mono/diheme cytochrome c family protein